MIPPITDPKWQTLISNVGSIPVTNLATKFLISRLKLLTTFEKSEETKQEGIKLAYDFFVKNESIVKDDIKLIFG
jgi:hypothetical protein